MSIIIGQDRKQIEFVSLDQQVDEDALIRVIDLFVDKIIMPVPEIAKELEDQYMGRPSYASDMLLKLCIYGYMNKLRSSRTLMRACHINIEVRWLTGKLEPDFRTISDFRKDHLELMTKVFKMFTAFYHDLKDDNGNALISLGYTAVDGTKIRASQAKDKCFTASKLDDRIKHCDSRLAEVDRFLAEWASIDAAEDAAEDEEAKEKVRQERELKSKTIPSKEAAEKTKNTYTERKEKYEQIRTTIEETNDQYSETDPDARLMKNHYGGFNPAYNIQAGVDSESHLIEGFITTNKCTDHGQLEPIAEETGSNDIVADNGYNSPEDIAACLEKGVVPNVFPDSKLVDGHKVKGDTISVSFLYEENKITEEELKSDNPEVIKKCLRAGKIPEKYNGILTVPDKHNEKTGLKIETRNVYKDSNNDAYIDDLTDEELKNLAASGYFVRNIKRDLVCCPQGIILRRKSTKKDRVRYCNKFQCRICRSKCFTESQTTKWKEIDFLNGQRVKPAAGEKSGGTKREITGSYKVVRFDYHPDRGKLDNRKCIVEHVFGTVKRALFGDHFLLRTKKKVNAEVALLFLGYNIKRVCNIVSTERILATLRAI